MLLVGGLLILAACVPSTPAPLSIPQTGNTTQPGTTGTGVAGTDQPATGGTGVVGTGQPGSSVTIIPPGSTGTAASGTGGQQGTAVPGQGSATQGAGSDPTDSGIPLTDPQPTDRVPPTTTTVKDYNYSNFLGELRSNTALTVEEMGEVQEPFFNVAGRQVRVNGADVTVFEFPDAAAHQTALQTVTENGGVMGAITPAWVGRPNFYSKGNLIALYIGSDQQTLDLLRQRFGDPITYSNQINGLSADTAFRIQSRLSDRFNVGLDQIRIVDVSQQQWSDACLGLGGPAESCLKVVTPGYSMTVEVGGTRYTVRTNQNASLLRFQQQ